MGNNVVEMTLIGYHHFQNKEKTEEYHIVQGAYYENVEEMRAQVKATVIPIFVELAVFQKIANKKIGDKLKVQVIPNLSTGKIYYKVLV